jgi:alpha-glucosidase (family GH31 glycosyl hydrolase)
LWEEKKKFFLGYPLVLPDMIGGNGYNITNDPLHESTYPEKELFVRWLQANIFMPGMQFSFVPWLYDQEVIDYTKAMIALRVKYAPEIIALAKDATLTGEPINRPIWWLDPTDEIAHGIETGTPKNILY